MAKLTLIFIYLFFPKETKNAEELTTELEPPELQYSHHQ